MTSSDPNRGEPSRRPWQPRFGMGGLFLVVLIASVTAAAGSYLVRTLTASPASPELARQTQLKFLVFTMAAPVLLVVVLAGFLALLRRVR